MADVFNLVFMAFETVINTMKKIPVWDDVSLYDFSIGIIIFTVVFVGILSVVNIGATSPRLEESAENVRFKSQTRRDVNKAIQAQKDLENERGY